jgi:hypothetical protein
MQQKRCENLIKVRSQIWTGNDHLKITTPPTNSLKKIKYIKNYWLERATHILAFLKDGVTTEKRVKQFLPRFQSNLKQKCKQKSNDLYFFEYFYPRVYVVYRWVYILLCCCCCSCCCWEAFNQTCQYFGRQLIKNDYT